MSMSTLASIMQELMDGDIIVFQEEPSTQNSYELPTARDYFRDLFYKVITDHSVDFCVYYFLKLVIGNVKYAKYDIHSS